MPFPLLQTKLYVPPPRPQLVARPAITAKLQMGAACPVTLVAAPAGFGKTTLVSEWIRQTDQPVAWLSLDEEDNDPGRFLLFLVAALRSVHPSIGEITLAALQAPQLPPITQQSDELGDAATTKQSESPPAATFVKRKPFDMAQDKSPIVNLVEPLSERELEILQLVAAGLSNSQLADELIVTVGTVKKHLNNIYGKLGVASRTQAIGRGRELGLLTD